MITTQNISKSGYGLHRPILAEYINEYKPFTVFEFGCGHNSTPLFIDRCADVTSVEMQKPDWFIDVWIRYGLRPNFKLVCMMGPKLAPEYLSLLPVVFDLIFIDGHMARWSQINSAFKKTSVIITHDTDQPCYEWGKIELPAGWSWRDITITDPWTAIITRNNAVAEWAKQFDGETITDMSAKTYRVK